MKTQYILTFHGYYLTALVDDPAEIYWNRALQMETEAINPISLYYAFCQSEMKHTLGAVKDEAFRTGAYPIHLDYIKTYQELCDEAEKASKEELEIFDLSRRDNEQDRNELLYFQDEEKF